MEITFRNLQKSFDGRRVLNVKEGRIKSGARTAIIGPNGAGKSTLINILAGLEKADAGEVRYDGAADFPQQDVTLVFQNPYLISTTVEKNLAYPLKLRGWQESAVDARVTELLEELGLSAFRRQKAWKLSGGETQKAALARALSFKPKLLLLDEPTANIDPYTTAEIEKLLLSIGQKQDTTIVMITHNLAQAKRVCDEIIMLHEGELIETGPAMEILTEPRQEQTRRFVAGELLL